MANRSVKDFEFPASFGFTGSGGMTPVRGYMRGGSVAPKKGPEARVSSPPPAVGWTDYKKGGKVDAKIGKVMTEFKAGELHSGSKNGPVVKNRRQAVAIAMSEAGKKKMAEGGKVHDDKAEDLKMIRAEIKKSGKASRK